MSRRLLFVLLMLVMLGLVACEEEASDEASSDRESRPPDLIIVSGSENRTLEDLIEVFEEQEDVNIQIDYLGSLDIMLMLRDASQREAQQAGTGLEVIAYDAVWPANSLWLDLGDEANFTKSDTSILRSPVVLGIKRSVAESLGWIDTEVTVQMILEAAEAENLQLMMTSATQSNSGASAYFGFLYALSGQSDVLTSEDLADPTLEENIRAILGTIDRSSRSSGFLKDLFLSNYTRFDGMYNYEAVIIEANQALVADDKEPLYVIYPVDGMAIADSPLAFVDRGLEGREELFDRLQAYLLSESVQNTLANRGRRTAGVGLAVSNPDLEVWNPDWGVQADLSIEPIQFPRPDVIDEALTLYQTSFRKGSFTVFCLDYSGSMLDPVTVRNPSTGASEQSTGEIQLEAAMGTLLIEDIAARYLLQASPRDVSVVIPFNNELGSPLRVAGNDSEELLGLYNDIQELGPGGRTEMYKCVWEALQIIEEEIDFQQQFPAIILMTDGKSDTAEQNLVNSFYATGDFDIPIFSITFGNADDQQLEDLATLTGGDVYNGNVDLAEAFRRARGNN